MAIEAIEWAFCQRTGATAKLVLLALADHADRDGYCWPGIDRIAQRTDLSRSTIIRAIEQLAEQGLVLKARRPNRSNRYQLALFASVRATPR